MHIDRIEVKGFGKLSGSAICLKKGMNVIYGSNEAGKTTLQWFIRGMLYGLKASGQSRSGSMQPRKRFAPWGGGQFGGSLVYTLDDGSSCRVERDFEKDTVKLFDSYFNDITDLFEKGRDKQPAFADRQLGLDEAAFDRTVLIRQLEVRLNDDSAAVLAGRLANAGSTGFDDISFSRAEKALADALKNNVGTGRTTTQPLDRLEARLRQLTAEHERLLKQQGQKNTVQKDLSGVQDSRSRLEAESRYLNQIGELIEVRKALDLNLKQEAGLKEAVRCLKEHERSLEIAAEHTGQHDVPRGRATVYARKPYPVPFIYLTSAVLFILLFAYFAITNETGYTWLFIPICGVGALAGGAAAILTFRGDRASKEVSGDILTDGSQIKSICSSASLLCGRLLNDPAAVRQELKEVAQKLDKLSSRLETGIEEAVKLAAGEECCFAPEELDTFLYDSTVEYLEKEWRSETERVNKKLLDAALKEKYCEGLLVDSREDNDELQHVEEETVAVLEKIAYLKHRGDALKLAREVLMEAGLEIRHTLAPGLDSRLSSIIAGLTAGKYADLRGDDKLALKVAVPESGDIKNALLLSGAASDQMYLALRLAMADILTAGGESLPLLMDEVFSQFDDNRTALALNYFKNAYEKRQVLIFTCKQREVELAREICGDSLNLVEL